MKERFFSWYHILFPKVIVFDIMIMNHLKFSSYMFIQRNTRFYLARKQITRNENAESQAWKSPPARRRIFVNENEWL